MEAHFFRLAVAARLATVVCALVVFNGFGLARSEAAGFRSENFTVNAPTPDLAREICLTAEKMRKELAIEWLGKEMPSWSKPCPIHAQVDPNLGAGGATSFLFQNGEVFRWRMSIQGSRERILDSVLPHEITHTIFASHFRQPLPRWADEGACTTVEHESEKAKQQRMLIRFLKTGHGIAFSDLFAMKEYPADVMPLYSQGYSLARFLIAQGGKKKFLDFVGDGLRDENWPRAVRKNYGAESLWALQNTWLDWVRDGSPSLDRAPGNRSYTQLASANRSRQITKSSSNVIYRAQSADPPETSQASGGLVSLPKNSSSERSNSSAAPGQVTPSVYQRNRTSSIVSPGNVTLRATPSSSSGSYSPEPNQAEPNQITPSTTLRASPSSVRLSPENASPARVAPAPPPSGRQPRVLLEWKRSEAVSTNSSGPVYTSRLDSGTLLR